MEARLENQAWLRVLGPVEMRGGDGGLRRGGPQLRLLLALLALSAGQVVPVADLVDALWEERPPPSARASLQILVVRLRKPLGAVPGCSVDRYGDGYQLQVGPDLVDVHRFRSLVRSARAAGDDEQAAALLGEALELWRGPALADVPGTAMVEAIRAGLAEEHLSAVQDRFGRLLAVGRHTEAAADIPSMLARHPLAERLAGLLMIAWYRSGRQAEALQVFRDLRGRLAGELGVEPGAELQRLHQQILSGDPALAAPGHHTGSRATGGATSVAGRRSPSLAPPPGRRQPAAAPQQADSKQAGTLTELLGNHHRGPGHAPGPHHRPPPGDLVLPSWGNSNGNRNGNGTSHPPRPQAIVTPVSPQQLPGRTGEPKAVSRLSDEVGDAGRTAVTSAISSPPHEGKLEGAHPGFEPQVPEPARDGSGLSGFASAGAVSVAPFRRVYQLPPDVLDFAGRSAECSRLAELIIPAEGATAVTLAVVSGPPGIGKTSLALHVAHALREQFPDGQLYIQLAGSSASPRRTGEVLGELLRALGVTPGSIPGEVQARSAMLRSCLADRRVLLLADDAASAAQVRMLVPGTAGCAVVVTSRDRLAGLTASHVHLESLQPGEALEMLGRIVGAERVTDDPAAAAGLVAACGHLPLAVRIAGARLAARPSWPVATLAALVASQRQRLDELTVGDLEVRATLELGYQTLPAHARKAFRLLSLAGPFDVAGWVVTVLLGSADATNVVNQLVDKSMLGAGEVDATGQPRYRLHDLLRDYAGERLAREPQRERVAGLERMMHAWLQLARQADEATPCNPYLPPARDHPGRPVLPREIAAGLTASPDAWFSTERLNLRHVTALACAEGQPMLALQLVSRQAAFHHSQARFDEAEQLWRMVSEAAGEASDKAVAAHAAFGLAITRAMIGYHAEVIGMIDQCARAFEELGDQRTLAYALYWQAACAVATLRRPQALEYCQHGLDIARRNRDLDAEIMLLREAAMALGGIRGREEEAIGSAKHALDMARQASKQTHELDTMRVLAHVNNLTGRHSTAKHIARRGIDLAGERHYIADRAYFQGSLGDAFSGLGRYQDAINVFARALPTFREHGLRRHEALCMLKMAESYLALGQVGQARAYLAQSQPAFIELRMPAYIERVHKAMERCPKN